MIVVVVVVVVIIIVHGKSWCIHKAVTLSLQNSFGFYSNRT